MREIKFRAWQPPFTSIGFGKMYSPAFPTWNGDIEVWKDNSPQTETELLSPLCGHEPILMQYTGLKDKNGKEICEGDIVKGPRGNYPVEYIDGSFCINDHDDGYWAIRGRNKWFEVIGTIYENPELLQG